MKSVLIYNIYDVYNRNNEIFRADSPLNRDGRFDPLIHLKAALAKCGYRLDTIDSGSVLACDYLLFFDAPAFLSQIDSFYFLRYMGEPEFRRKMMLFLLEPPVVHPDNWNVDLHRYFDTVFTWYDDIVDNHKYVKIQNVQPDKRYAALPFREKRWVVLINADKSSGHPLELYSERRKAIRYFEANAPDRFDLYGWGWDADEYPSFRGAVEEKGEVLSRYKFAVCFENMGRANGYMTEKIFDCFRSGCVPIYLGAANVTDYIPEDAFIDFRRFVSYDELYRFLLDMPQQRYEAYLQAADRYMRGPLFRSQFSKEAFAETVIRRIRQLEEC